METVADLKSRKYSKQDLAKEVFTLRNKVKKLEGEDPNIRAAEERAGVDALSRVGAVSPEQMASNMTGLGVQLNATINQVTTKIVEGRNTLEDLEKACDAKKEELENLFGQEILSRSIGNLLADFDAKRKEFKAKSEELDEELDRKEQSIERQKSEWDSEFNKHVARREQEFEYLFAQKKQQATDEFNKQIKAQQVKFEDEQRERERSWQDREIALQKTESEIAKRLTEAEGLEEALKAQFAKEKAVEINSIKREFEHKAQIAETNAKTAQQIAQNTINRLEETLVMKQAEVESLKKQLESAEEKVANIAGKALDAAGGTLAMEFGARLTEGPARPRGKA